MENFSLNRLLSSFRGPELYFLKESEINFEYVSRSMSDWQWAITGDASADKAYFFWQNSLWIFKSSLKLTSKKNFKKIWPREGVVLSLFFSKLATRCQLCNPKLSIIARIEALGLTNNFILLSTLASLVSSLWKCLFPRKLGRKSGNFR